MNTERQSHRTRCETYDYADVRVWFRSFAWISGIIGSSSSSSSSRRLGDHDAKLDNTK